MEETKMNHSSLNKTNPTRKECETIITRILHQEIQQRNKNCHFRHSVDFLPYFESLYPASEGLSKQVQRAVRSLNLPKDSSGYYIINRSQDEIDLESHLIHFFQYEKLTLTPSTHNDLALVFHGKADESILKYCKDRLTKYFNFSISDFSIWIEDSEIYFHTPSISEMEQLFHRLGIPVIDVK